ncbi:hypothetical protein ACC738_39245, partial [Rhizobium ruizarguesonis]
CRFAFPAERRPLAPAHLNSRLSIVEALKSRTVIIFMLLWLVGNALIAVGIPLVGENSKKPKTKPPICASQAIGWSL